MTSCPHVTGLLPSDGLLFVDFSGKLRHARAERQCSNETDRIIMMEGIRRAGKSRIGKVAMAILFGLLIFSFGIWGIGDMVRNWGQTTIVATVGSTQISQAALRETYQTELQTLSRRARRNITNDEARALGLEQQVLQRLVSEAAIDQQVRNFGLAVSDETIAKAITTDPTFAGPDGSFDRRKFDQLMRDNGFTEQSFVRSQRAFFLRQQIADTIAGGMMAPALMRDALHRYRAETRDADFIIIGPDQTGTVADPDAGTLARFFEERKDAFRAPEYRSVAILVLSPGDAADPASIPLADAKGFYDRNLSRFGEPERREVQQIVFPSLEEARSASDRIKAGESFAAIATERKLSASDIDLGLVTREGIIDPKVAETAFSLSSDSVSEPVEGRFGTVLLRVGAVLSGDIRPFADVEPEIRRELAIDRARDAVRTLHDTIEDQRASARPLAEIAAENQLNLRTIVMDRTGRDKAGQLASLPDRETLIKAMMASDVGVDNDSIATRDGGWVWFDIQSIEPARERKLDEVSAQVLSAWKDEQAATLASEKAADLVKRLNGGATLADLAKELGVALESRKGITREGTSSGLTPAALTQIFGTKVESAGTALGANASQRIIFRVLSAGVPPLVSSGQDAARLDEQVRVALGDDIVGAYIAKVEKDLGVKVNEAGLRQALGSN